MMKVGEKITFNFGTGQKEGVIEKIFSKKVYLRADFPRHTNKLIVRKISDLEGGPSTAKNKKAKKEKKK
jgi:hypothetical protein